MFSSKFLTIHKNSLIYLCVFWFLCINTYSQKTIEKGKVTDSIKVLNTLDETFAIYIPNSFDEKKKSPIIFIFEPAARGSIGLSSFIEASEQYGYILVCSNNSKNGSYEQNFSIANNLFNQIFKSFSIDQDKMYLAGFSGGSRLASTIAVLTNNFSGVIACGAGFASEASYIPSTQKFSYVGLCGNEDMNYKEMIGNNEYLQRLGFDNTLITYNGDHKWPPKEQVNRALRWLQNKKNDSLLISKNLSVDISESEGFESSGELLFAAENYTRILNKYEKLILSKKFKDEYKSLQNALQQENKISNRLFDRLQKDFLFPEKANIDWWKKELNKLSKLKKSGSQQQQKMIARVRFNIFAAVYSRKNKNLYKSSSKQIDLSNNIQALVYQE